LVCPVSDVDCEEKSFSMSSYLAPTEAEMVVFSFVEASTTPRSTPTSSSAVIEAPMLLSTSSVFVVSVDSVSLWAY